MPTDIDRSEVRRLLEEGAQLVDALPAEEFAEAHLPGAINLPLKKLEANSARRLAADRPIITYCHDFQ